ncbi:MAG: cytochrome o ubiquinol oxidase subunit III [Psychromonas sp.]|nr:cytochrome o ubiquinol oxidase subunit III [Psychromonas sp.]
MTTEILTAHAEGDESSTDVFGFWLYIMSDCILFSCLFATFIVLRHNTFGGVGMREITNLPYVFKETLFLLASSFTFGMAILSMYKNHQSRVIGWLIVTFLLGLSFVTMEVNEFANLISEGHGPQTSGAMSAFFTLVGTHGLHVSLGLFWMLVLIIQTAIFKLNPTIRRRLTYLGLFWAFLDIVWIFVFTIVYLMGVA